MRSGLPKRGGLISQVLYILSLLCLGVGLFILGWAVWPAPSEGVQIPISKGVLPGAPSGTNYASSTDYTLNVSWPRWLHVDDVGAIQLTLTATEQGQEDANEGEVQIVVADPRINSLKLSPAGTIQANLAPGNDLAMTWEVEVEQSGEFSGKLLVSFGFYDETLDELVVVPVVVVDMLIIVIALWGLGSRLAIWFSLVGIVLWGALFLLGRIAQAKGR